MYRKPDRAQMRLEEIFLPFGGTLSADNRWAEMAKLIPWDMDEKYWVNSKLILWEPTTFNAVGVLALI